jgi:hypothetical protein
VNFGEILSDVGCQNREGVFSARILVVLLWAGIRSAVRTVRVVVRVLIFFSSK